MVPVTDSLFRVQSYTKLHKKVQLKTPKECFTPKLAFLLCQKILNLHSGMHRCLGFVHRCHNTIIPQCGGIRYFLTVSTSCREIPSCLVRVSISNCLSQWRGEPKFSIALVPRSVDVCIVYKKKKKVSKENHRAPITLGPCSAVVQFFTADARNAFFFSPPCFRASFASPPRQAVQYSLFLHKELVLECFFTKSQFWSVSSKVSCTCAHHETYLTNSSKVHHVSGASCRYRTASHIPLPHTYNNIICSQRVTSTFQRVHKNRAVLVYFVAEGASSLQSRRVHCDVLKV